MTVPRLVGKLKSCQAELENLYTTFGALRRDGSAPNAGEVEQLVASAKPQIDRFRQLQKIVNLMVQSQEPKKRRRPQSQYTVLRMAWGCIQPSAGTQSLSRVSIRTCVCPGSEVGCGRSRERR